MRGDSELGGSFSNASGKGKGIQLKKRNTDQLGREINFKENGDKVQPLPGSKVKVHSRFNRFHYLLKPSLSNLN